MIRLFRPIVCEVFLLQSILETEAYTVQHFPVLQTRTEINHILNQCNTNELKMKIGKGMGKFWFSLFCFSVETSFGPMSRDVDGLVQGMRALWDGYMFDLDPSVVPMTFDEEVSSQIHEQCHYGYGYMFDLEA